MDYPTENSSKYKKKIEVLPLFYWGDVVWLKYLVDFQGIKKFSLVQTYRKQRNFNRAYYLGGNGVDYLTIPVSYSGVFPTMKEIKICYKEDWRRKHLKKIYYAYKNAAYFEFYWDSLRAVYAIAPEYLWEFNFEVVRWLQRNVFNFSVELTEEYVPAVAFSYRLEETPPITFPSYFQLFTQTFIPNLSSLDLLMNMGQESLTYLKNISLNYNELSFHYKKVGGGNEKNS